MPTCKAREVWSRVSVQVEQRSLQVGKGVAGRTWRKPGSGSPLLLLDKRTNSGSFRQTTDWERVLTVRDLSKVGVMEFGTSWVQRGKVTKRKETGIKKPENWERSVKRTRANVKRHCLQIQAAWILTLTYHENMQDRERAVVDRQDFDRKMKKHYGEGWQSVAVAEQQKRGAWHWHIATGFQVDQPIALKAWREVTGDPTITQVHNGFSPDGKGNAYGKCSGYLSKYITKDLEQGEEFRHRYHVQRGSAVLVQHFTIALKAPRDTEKLMMLEMAVHYLGLGEFDMWTAPVPAGSRFSFVRCEKKQLQPKGVR